MSRLAIAFFVLAVQVAPQGPGGIGVQAVVAPDSVRIGQVLTLTVTVSGVADNAEVSFLVETPATPAGDNTWGRIKQLFLGD